MGRANSRLTHPVFILHGNIHVAFSLGACWLCRCCRKSLNNCRHTMQSEQYIHMYMYAPCSLEVGSIHRLRCAIWECNFLPSIVEEHLESCLYRQACTCTCTCRWKLQIQHKWGTYHFLHAHHKLFRPPKAILSHTSSLISYSEEATTTISTLKAACFISSRSGGKFQRLCNLHIMDYRINSQIN